MNITILNSSEGHPINEWLIKWVEKNKVNHRISLHRSKNELVGGDILFLISCTEIIVKCDRDKFKKTLLIHAGDLPKSRGWSPHIWELINGAEEITLSLLEAEDKVDSGEIWKKIKINIPKIALYKEINELLFDAELELIDYAVNNFSKVETYKQDDEGMTYWPKRTPDDSKLDIQKTIFEQFDLIRVCDTERFPAFFYKDGEKFTLKIEKVDE